MNARKDFLERNHVRIIRVRTYGNQGEMMRFESLADTKKPVDPALFHPKAQWYVRYGKVAPRAGAWIEIWACDLFRGLLCRSPCGSVD